MFLNYINNVRGFVIIFIVGYHSFWLLDWPEASLQKDLLETFFKGASAYFTFISGFLFQHLAHKYEVRDYLKKKFFNVILPYLLISIPAIVKIVFVEQSGIFQEYPAYSQVILYYLTGEHVAPFWFIPMITLFFLASPLLYRLDQTKWFYYLLPLFVILSFIVPRERGIHIFPPQSFVHFISIYVFGMFISHYKQQILNSHYFYWVTAGILFFVLFYLELTVDIFRLQQILNYLKGVISIILVVYLFYRFDEQIGKKLALLGQMSFGIFFLHEYVNWVVGRAQLLIWGERFPGNVFTFIFVCGLCLFICAVLLAIGKKLLGSRSRMFIGY